MRALVAAMALLCCGSAAAEERLSSYARPVYSLGEGGSPVTLEELQSEPARHFRTQTAYHSFLDHLGVSDTAELQWLLGSKLVRVIACEGSILTAGLPANGAPRWYLRSCYRNEQLLEKRTGNEWKLVASLGCLNPSVALPFQKEVALPSEPVWLIETAPAPVAGFGETGAGAVSVQVPTPSGSLLLLLPILLLLMRRK